MCGVPVQRYPEAATPSLRSLLHHSMGPVQPGGVTSAKVFLDRLIPLWYMNNLYSSTLGSLRARTHG
jgi:hypothetical protein